MQLPRLNRLIIFFIFLWGTIGNSAGVYGQDASGEGGFFIPRNGFFEGKIGLSHALIDKHSGGTLDIISGDWPSFETVGKLGTIFRVLNNDSRVITVRQVFDKDPKILFLEEGNERMGIRVLYKLFDSANIYYGHGMSETWFYPDGQIFVTQAAMFENETVYKTVVDARIDIDIAGDQRINAFENLPEINMNDNNIPERFIFLTSDKASDSRLGLYWRTGRMEHDTYITRRSFGIEGAPNYFQWPDYFRQAYTQLTSPGYVKENNKIKWPPGRGAYLESISFNKNGVQLVWPIKSELMSPSASFNGVFRLAMVPNTDKIKSFVDNERIPVKLSVRGGTIHGNLNADLDKGYNDQEGCYEVRKFGSEPLIINLPKSANPADIRIKVIGLTSYGAVKTTLNNEPVIPQLVSDGGIADDPLAPISEEPEAPAQMAVISARLGPEEQSLKIEEVPGIQLTYQSRDSRRNFTIYSTKSGPRWSSMKFSLFDGHATNMRGYGKKDWAFTENLIHWFSWMGYTPEQMVDQLRSFKLIKNGPDEIVFRYVSNNYNDGASSESTIRISANSPVMLLKVSTTFRVLNDHWPYKSVQFFDGFPFRGVDPNDWWFQNVLYMNQDGKWSTYNNLSQKTKGDPDASKGLGTHFTAMYSSERGNVFILTKNYFQTNDLFVHNEICTNYVDLHMNVTNILNDDHTFIMSRGFNCTAEYEMAIGGDTKITETEAKKIGEKSIQNGSLTFP